MDSHELAEINASLQAIVRRAYDLGRTEALKRVIDVLNEDRPTADQLALMAPDKPPDTSHHHSPEKIMNGQQAAAPKPWWAQPAR